MGKVRFLCTQVSLAKSSSPSPFSSPSPDSNPSFSDESSTIPLMSVSFRTLHTATLSCYCLELRALELCGTTVRLMLRTLQNSNRRGTACSRRCAQPITNKTGFKQASAKLEFFGKFIVANSSSSRIYSLKS